MVSRGINVLGPDGVNGAKPEGVEELRKSLWGPKVLGADET